MNHRKIKIILLIVVTSVISISVAGQELIIPRDSITIDFTGVDAIQNYYNIYWLSDNHDLPIDTIASEEYANKFQRLCTSSNDLQPGQTHWLRFQLRKTFDIHRIQDQFYCFPSLVFGTKNINHLYLRDSINQEWVKELGSYHLSSNERTLSYFHFWYFRSGIMDLPLANQETLTYYLKLEHSERTKIDRGSVFIMSRNQLARNGELVGFISVFILGIIGIMMIYSFGMFVLIQERSYLYYMFYCGCNLVYNIYSYQYFGEIISSTTLRFITYRVLAISGVFIPVGFLMFIRYYLDFKQYSPFWDTVYKWVSYVLGFVGCFYILIIMYDIDIFLYHPVLSFSETTVRISLIIPVILFIATLKTIITLPIKRKYFIITGGGFVLLAAVVAIFPLFRMDNFVTTFISSNFIVPFGQHLYTLTAICMTIETVIFAFGLAYRIKENEEEKQKAFLQLQQSETEKQISQLQKNKVEEVSQLKSKLYTNITHEFRTPLTVILGQAKEIQESGISNESDKAKAIQNSGERLLNLVNQILELARLEGGHIETTTVQDDIVPYISYLIDSFQSYAQQEQISLSFYSDKEAIVMDFDPEKIQRIITNLVSNALKFTPIYGKVHVQVEHQETTIQITVKDSGIGIKQEDLPYVFDRFYQVSEKSNRGQVGSGIGLTLVKELVEALEGQIEVNSTYGMGSTFVIRLPITNKAPQQSVNLKPLIQYIETNAVQTEKENLIDNKENTVLIIEDNQEVMQYIVSLLAPFYTIQRATNGEQGTAMAIEKVPDLIISDVMMPRKNGFEVCNELKQNIVTSHIPIILLTAKANLESKIEGIKKGADAYLPKPFDKQELLATIDTMLQNRRRVQQQFQQITSTAPTSSAPTPEQQFIQQVQEIILNQLDNDLFSPAFLASQLSISQSQLYRKLKAITGKSVALYIRSVRLQRAYELLKTTNLSIKEIAYDCGFSNPNWFAKAFRETFDKTPSEVRK